MENSDKENVFKEKDAHRLGAYGIRDSMSLELDMIGCVLANIEDTVLTEE